MGPGDASHGADVVARASVADVATAGIGLRRRDRRYMLSWRGGSPFTADGDDMVAQSGERVRLLGAVRAVCRELLTDDAWGDVRIGISSRTDEPAWARELLDDGFFIDAETRLGDVFHFREITKESKSRHFARIADREGIAYEDILFFDNERGGGAELYRRRRDPEETLGRPRRRPRSVRHPRYGNCREISDLGVTVAFSPDGVTADVWAEALASFPAERGDIVNGYY